MIEKTVLFHVPSICKVTKVFCSHGQYINKEQPIFEFMFDGFGSGHCFNLSAEDNCILKSINVRENDKLNKGNPLYSYQPIARDEEFEKRALEFRKPILQDTEFAKITDDFTNDITIKPHKIAGKEEEFIRTFIAEDNSTYGKSIGFSLETFNGKPFINFRSLCDDIRLNKSDEMILLFEDQIKINLVFSSKPAGGKGIKANSIRIDFEILQILLTKNFLKWKYIDNKTNEYLIGTFSCEEKKTGGQYSSIIEAQYLLRFYTAKFIEVNQKFNHG